MLLRVLTQTETVQMRHFKKAVQIPHCKCVKSSCASVTNVTNVTNCPIACSKTRPLNKDSDKIIMTTVIMTTVIIPPPKTPPTVIIPPVSSHSMSPVPRHSMSTRETASRRRSEGSWLGLLIGECEFAMAWLVDV